MRESRLDAAVARIAARIAGCLDTAGLAPDEARWLRSWSAEHVGDSDELARDGACLGLPTGGGREPVDRIAHRLQLTPGELDLLALAALPHHHEGAAATLRALHPERRPWPTVGLAGLLAEHGALAGIPDRVALRDVLANGRLAASTALTVDGDGTAAYNDRSLRLTPLLWEALTGTAGDDTWPATCTADQRPAPPWGLDGWLHEPAVVAARDALGQRAPVTVAARSDRPHALAARLAALVRAAGHEPAIVHVDQLDDRLVRGLLLLGVARDVVPVLWSDREPREPLTATAVSAPIVLAVRAEHAVESWPRPVLHVPTTPLGRGDRLAAAHTALPELGLEHAIGPATLAPTDLATTVGDVRAAAHFGGPQLSRSVVADAIDRRTTSAVPDGAYLVHPVATWGDLVLRDDRLTQLREAVARATAARVVFDEWGFLAGRSGHRGLRLLFCGPPGTGKTLAAEILAGELGRDLLVVDLSRMVSKWIGETEKNLSAAFDAAERGGAVLFFDEADALFGKRTEVGDARDRYANLETAYLLARLERFEGVAVLASNLRQNIDPAFGRRIEFIVTFDPPDVAERVSLWRCHLPAAAPVAASVDLERLAALYDLPGALIRNAAVAAAFLAASEPGGPAPITLRHVVHAIRREYQKSGNAFPGVPAGAAR